MKEANPTFTSSLLFWGCFSMHRDVLNPTGCTLKGELRVQFCSGSVLVALVGIARGIGVPRVMHSQQFSARLELVAFSALWVAFRISTV